MSTVKNNIKDPSTTLLTNLSFPIFRNIQSTAIINQTGSNDDGVTKLQGDKDGSSDGSKVLDDSLNYTIEIQRLNNTEKYGEWKAMIKKIIEKTFGSDSIEKQIKDALKLIF